MSNLFSSKYRVNISKVELQMGEPMQNLCTEAQILIRHIGRLEWAVEHLLDPKENTQMYTTLIERVLKLKERVQKLRTEIIKAYPKYDILIS